MMCLFPFERGLYEAHGVAVTHVGHPIFDALRAERTTPAFRESVGARAQDPLVALLPGSREHEVALNLPVMLEAARAVLARRGDVRFLVPCAHDDLRAGIERLTAEHGRGLPITVLDGHAREVARRARVAIVTSGTATLELLYHEVPMIVVYRTGQLRYALVRRFLLTVKSISLVNILADREIVPEFVGGSWSADDVARACVELLRDGRARKRCLAKLHELRREVVTPRASLRAAEVVLGAARSRAIGHAISPSATDLSRP
jgi:lipid-A-disaccharide synthase